MHFVVRFARGAVVVALLLTAATAGILSGVMFAYAGDLPEISALDNYAPSTITRVYASGGELVGEFAVQRRLIVGYEGIAPQLRQAIIAAEDGDFNTHFGLSISHIIAAVSRDILRAAADVAAGRKTSRPAGASTLTQQLARTLFPQAVGFSIGDLSLERKIKEAIVAVQIEKRYTKDEILTFYANHMLLGHGTYGVEAGARMYFGKSAKDVSLDEAAMLAGIFQSPGATEPVCQRGRRNRPQKLCAAADGRRGVHHAGRGGCRQEAAHRRQGAATAGQVERAVLPGRSTPAPRAGIRREGAVRRWAVGHLHARRHAAERGKPRRRPRRARRGQTARLSPADAERAGGGPSNRRVQGRALVAADRGRRHRARHRGEPRESCPANGARLRIGAYTADLVPSGFAWTRRPAASSLFKTGDLIEVQVQALDSSRAIASVSLEQRPILEGALVAIDNRTGQIKAMVGGLDFGRSKFNRAVQAFRQLGSTFKPVVYTAAIDRGYTPASVIVDEPVVYPSGSGEPYSPQNYDHKFEGQVTLRRSLEQSRNIPAIKVMDAIGPRNVVAYGKRFGFTQEFPPYLPIALGAGDGTLLEVTSAYTVFPNQGVRMPPFSIRKVTDRDGNLLEENRAEPVDVIRADTAYVVTNMLRGVVQRGTAASAASIEWPLAGKTGTVDENTDAWFVGFDPYITVGVWVGHDEKRPIGTTETGAAAALPIWIEFMKAYIDARPDKDTPPTFEAPGNIVFLAVDRSTGALLPSDTDGGISEAFISGTQPGGGAFR